MAGLRDFVIQQFSRTKWNEIKDAAGVDRETYTRMEDYPDEEFEGIYAVIVDDVEASDAELQQTFGRYLFGKLADMYGRIYFDDAWGPLDLIDNVEETIHKSLKQRDDSGFTPPELETEWLGDDSLAVLYGSDRHLCEFGKGLILGAAEYYDATLTISESHCMKSGADSCRIEVQQG